ncbi:MAG TPA: hypothetical protein PLI95_02945 [Polyangiaceae bacterium]|nr:hypothetical protein [Polyangiaceae bacterium]
MGAYHSRFASPLKARTSARHLAGAESAQRARQLSPTAYAKAKELAKLPVP